MAEPNDKPKRGRPAGRNINEEQVSEQGVRGAQQQGTDVRSTESRIEETGFGERSQIENADDRGILFLNAKRTYDEYQHESLDQVRANKRYIEKILSDAQSHTDTRNQIATQALQNAVETANMVGKQAVRHGDVAIDRQWNVDEQGFTVEKILNNTTFQDAIKAAVASAVNDAIGRKQ